MNPMTRDNDPTRHQTGTGVLVAMLLAIVGVGASAFAASTEPISADRLRSDLVGHSMGGRERGWMFQSREQIQDLVIQRIHETEESCTAEFSCLLQDPRVPWTYEAEAVATYHRIDDAWVLWTVGMRTLHKVE